MNQFGSQVPFTSRDRVIEVLKNNVGVEDMSDILNLMSKVSWLEIKGGSALFHQGENAESCYILIHGRMKAIRKSGDSIKVIGDISPGEMIGEMAMISKNNRNAEVVAIRDCLLVELPREEFKDIYFRHPQLAWDLSKLVIERFTPKDQTRKLRKVKNVVFLPGDQTIDTSDFIANLIDNMDDARVALITSNLFNTQSSSHSDFFTMVDNYEEDNHLVFYQADFSNTEWTEYCLRQADEIIVIAEDREDFNFEKPSGLAKINPLLVDLTLVISHRQTEQLPQHTLKLLSHLEFDYWYHIRKGHNEDIKRLKRHLTDQSRGLVLAGGGARGFAHLGVWKAIRKSGVTIDRIGGTSMGAFLGGLMALDHDFKTIYEIVKNIALSRPSSDLNPIPYASVILGKNLNRVLKTNYQHIDVSDCWIPFYCISADITDMKPRRHDRGDLYLATRASGSLPAIVPPVPIDNHWHVDGGIVENFPVQDMIDYGVRQIIGVSFKHGQNETTGYTEIPTLKNQILNGLFGRNKKLSIPSLIESVMLSTTTHSQHRQDEYEKQVDLLIQPSVDQYGLLEWKAFEKLIDIGYEATMRKLDGFNL